MVAGFSKWAGNLADRWVSVPCDGTFPRGGGLMGNAILGFSWIRPSDLECLTELCFSAAHISLGYGFQSVFGPIITESSGSQPPCPASSWFILFILQMLDGLKFTIDAIHAHHGWCPSCGHSVGLPFLIFSACLTPIHPSAPPLPGSPLGMEFASLPGSPETFKESFNQLIFMWNVPGLVLLFCVSMHKTDKILPLGNLYSRGH